jgi:hypothetical protein
MAVALDVAAMEPLGQRRQRLQVDLQLEPLPLVAQIGAGVAGAAAVSLHI